MLEGSKVEDGRTTFEIGSFSEIAVGYGVENVRVPVDAELKYETDEFEVTFRIEGEVNVPVDGMRPREEAGAYRSWKGYAAFLVYVRIRAHGGGNRFGCGRVSSACNDNAFRFVCNADGRFRLRSHDFRES